ncbi:hypothetical protein R6Q59_007162 [Mikania micrantha]
MVEYESPKKGQDLFLDKKVPTKDGLDKLHHLRELGVALFLITNQKELMNWITNLRDLRSSRLRSKDNQGRASNLMNRSMSNLCHLSHLNLLEEKLPETKLRYDIVNGVEGDAVNDESAMDADA